MIFIRKLTISQGTISYFVVIQKQITADNFTFLTNVYFIILYT